MLDKMKKSMIPPWCPDCAKKSVRSQVVPKRVNETTALWKCSSTTCIYPLRLKPEIFQAHIQPVSEIDPGYFSHSYLSITQAESCDNTNSNSSGGHSPTPTDVAGVDQSGDSPPPADPPTPPDVAPVVVVVSSKSLSPVADSAKKSMKKQSSATARGGSAEKKPIFRNLILQHLGKRPAADDDNAKSYSNSVSNMQQPDSKKANFTLAKPEVKKQPQQSLTSSGSVSFFPGYVASSSGGLTDTGDSKSDGGGSDGARGAHWGISPKIKQTLRATMKSLPTSTATPNILPNPNMNSNPNVRSNMNLNTSTPVQHRQSVENPVIAPFDFTDPFASYDLMLQNQLTAPIDGAAGGGDYSSGFLPLDPSSSFPLEPSAFSDFDANPSYFSSDGFHSL